MTAATVVTLHIHSRRRRVAFGGTRWTKTAAEFCEGAIEGVCGVVVYSKCEESRHRSPINFDAGGPERLKRGRERALNSTRLEIEAWTDSITVDMSRHNEIVGTAVLHVVMMYIRGGCECNVISYREVTFPIKKEQMAQRSEVCPHTNPQCECL